MKQTFEMCAQKKKPTEKQKLFQKYFEVVAVAADEIIV